MAGFDLHRLAAAHGGGLVVDVQSDLLDPFSTRVVVPLVAREAAPDAPRRLNPVIAVHDTPLILATHLLAALPRAALGPPVGSLAHERDRIRDALDMLFLGF
jgi:toxin CcdB